MILSEDEKIEIGNQVALHSKYMLDFEWSQDYRFVRLWDQNTRSLCLPSDWKRRTNDILAAAYIHAVALNQGSGDDCVDPQGNTYEVKLTYIRSQDFTVTDRGAIIQRSNARTPKGILQACRANFRVYGGTSYDHHNKPTAYVLMSEDHRCFITGYMMAGDQVTSILHSGQKSEERSISLSQFQSNGYEIGSSCHNIGWEKYVSALRGYLQARDGLLVGSDRDTAVDSWLNLLPSYR